MKNTTLASLKKTISVGLVDDHHLIREAIKKIIIAHEDYQVTINADSSSAFLQEIERSGEPHIALIDIKMPEMDGFELTTILTENYPNIKIIGLSAYVDDLSVVKMLQIGAKGYLSKGCDPQKLFEAMETVMNDKVYKNELVANACYQQITGYGVHKLTERQIEFLTMVGLNMSYEEIGDKMCVSKRTVHGYRDTLYKLIGINNRVALARYSYQKGICPLEDLIRD